MAAKKASPAETQLAEVKVKALIPVEHDGVRHEPDDEFDVSSTAATALENVRAVVVLTAQDAVQENAE